MKRNKFNLSHYHLLTCKMGQLVPIGWMEVLPGDTIQHATSGLIRCAPVVTPVMHPVRVRFHHFFVPNRIIWTNFQNYITGGPTGTDTTSHPYINFATGATVGSLGDYLGVQTGDGGTAYYVNALPFRAYNAVWNEWFRDEDLQSPVAVSLGDGADSTTSVALQNACWEKDYLTSARPWTSKGNAVSVPLQGAGVVTGIGAVTGVAATTQNFWENKGTGTQTTGSAEISTGVAIAMQANAVPGNTNLPQIFAQLSPSFPGGGLTQAQVTAGLDPIALRHGMAVMRYQEARARFGSRYTEYLRYFGVRSSDARLQRPEYLGGGRQTIQFSEVMQTGVTTSGTGGGAGGIGQYGGHGISAMRSNRYRRFFEEHGIVLTLMSVVPRSMYSQRMKRGWFRGSTPLSSGTVPYAGLSGTKEDYWQKELQFIGQQGVNGLEVDWRATNAVFGYQDRYDEYRREESTVHGLFRTTLDTWHLSREFTSAVSLNASFVSSVPSTRVFADTANDNLYCMINHHVQARRLVARSGENSFIK